MYLLARWLMTALAVMAAAYLVPGISVSGFYAALLVAFVLGIVNAILRPLLLLLTLPLNIVTLGLFTFVLNGFLFWFVSTIIKGLEVRGFWAAITGALVVTVISWMANQYLKRAPTAFQVRRYQSIGQ